MTPSKKRVRKSGQTGKNPARKFAAQQSDSPITTIQVIALVVIVLVAAGIIWAVVSSQQQSQTGAPPNTASSGGAPKLVGTRQYSSAPPMTIDKSKQYTATVKM